MESRRKSTRASSRATSIDSKKSTNDKEKDRAAASGDVDVESISSGSSMTECRVVLDRISSASFNTRSRRKSNLTVGNVAKMDSPVKGRRSKVSESVASDDTGLSRTRASLRLSSTQTTPKKEAKSMMTTRAAAATPTRRSSRLVDSIDLTCSPIIPAKRALRSNSVASDDFPPASPSTRRPTRSSRLADSQGTPNKVKIDSESVMTPGRKSRASRLIPRHVKEIKEEEEEAQTVSIIELSDDTSQSSPKLKSKKLGAAKSKTQTSNVKSETSSKNIEIVTVNKIESEGKVLLIQTSTANLKQLHELPEIENKSSDAITETAKPSNDLNAVLDTSVPVGNVTPIESLQSDQTVFKEKSSVENNMAENVKNDAIIVDEAILHHQNVDSINVNSSDSAEPEISKPQTETSMKLVLVMGENVDKTPSKDSEKSFASEKKTPLTKSTRADLDFMFEITACEPPALDKLASKHIKDISVSGTDPTMQVEKLQTPKKDPTKPKTPSENELSLMNVTELINSPKPDTSVIKLPSHQSKSPKAQTPSKNIRELADMDVQTTESVNIFDPMNITELVNSPEYKQDFQETGAVEKQSPEPKQKTQTADSVNAFDLMNVTELVNSPKPKQNLNVAVAIEKQTPKPKTMSPKQRVQTAEPTNTLNLMNATELVSSPKPKQHNEKAVIEKKSPKSKTPSMSAIESVDVNVTKPSDANITDAKEIKKVTPKKVPSQQNTPKSTPVSDKIATPKNNTPKLKDLNEFGDMNDTKLVDEVTVKTPTPKKTEENVSASVPETVTQIAESDKMEGANNQIAKLSSSTQKQATPKKSPLSSTLADESINLNLEISKIYESLQSPSDKTKSNKPNIFAIPIDDGKILDDTVEPMDVDENSIGNMTSTSINEQPDNQLDADDKNMSSVSVSSRKSVQILTPNVEKNKSFRSRLGTPYPDKKEHNAANSREEEIKKTAARFLGYVKHYQETLKPFNESCNQSKRVSTDNAGTSVIDKSTVNEKDQVDERPAKVAVPVRNNWSVPKGLIDSDSEPDSESDNIPENENEGEQSEEESVNSGFLDEKAEAIDDYQSGDSEDEEERQYREENELEHEEIDLGSEDTENEEDDSDSLDSFIVADSDEETHMSDVIPDDLVRNAGGRGRRFNRIILGETSSEEDEQIVSVSMSMVQQVAVVFGQDDQNGEENKIVEGKKFDTTILKNIDEEELVSKKQENSKKVDETAQVSQVGNESMVRSIQATNGSTTESTEAAKELENGSNIEEMPEKAKVVELIKENIQQDESNEPNTSEMPKEISAEGSQSTTVQKKIENIIETPVVQKDDKFEPCDSKSNQNETVHESNESDISTTSLKENETAQINIPKKMNRVSLSDLKDLPDSGRKMAKEINRKSLGNLVPNQQVFTVSTARVLHGQQSLLDKLMPKASKQAKLTKPVSEKSAIGSDDVEANTSARSIDSKVVRSQEEKNSKKPAKGSKAKKSAKKIETHSISRSFEEQDNVADAAVPYASKSTMSVDSGNFKIKNSKKQKRQFVEIETASAPSTPSRKPVKYLNIIESRSGKFIEEPITPEKKDRLGFKVTPMTPVNKGFRVEKLDSNATNEQVNKSKKRKIDHVEEPAIVLPKPHWTVEQDNVQPKKRARNILTGTTEMIIKPLNEKKRIKRARDIIPAELQRFREQNLYRAGIPRQDSRSLLMDRLKRLASQKK